MPIPGARYRMKPMKDGGYERLAFKDGNVVEAKNMQTGAMHTPAEFAQDRKKKKGKPLPKKRPSRFQQIDDSDAMV